MIPLRSSKPSRLMLIAAMVAAPVAALAQGTGAPPTDLHRYPLPCKVHLFDRLTLRACTHARVHRVGRDGSA